jgi:glycosyltransferase involved in cell wall biosynthesis
MKNKKIVYIADFSLPNMSAYMLHVLKMCDAFSERKLNVKLFVPYKRKLPFSYFKKHYLLKNKFIIQNFFYHTIKRNLFYNLTYSIKILRFLTKNKYKEIIISRSILPALILALMNFKVILEIHTEIRGFTKIIFEITKKIISTKNLKFVLIHKKLNEKLFLKKNQFIILDDCVDLRDFKFKTKTKYECVYTGSYVDGKGINTILEIAKLLPTIKFNLYGNIKTLNNDLFMKIKNMNNIILNNYVTYNKIPKILKSNKILLMPYEKQIGVLIKNLDVSDYISPLKLFDYLASGSIILATKKEAYSHVLKNNYNCFLINSYDALVWSEKIESIMSNRKNAKKLKLNAINTAKKYNWSNRCQKIINFAIND